jgi:ribosomal protein L11 methyltransferase
MKNPKVEPTAYVEVSVTVVQTLAEQVCDFVIENYSSGLVLEEEEGADLTTIKFYLPEDDTRDYRGELTALLNNISPQGSAAPIIDSRIVSNVDWEEQYRVTVEPIHIEPDIVIRAPWHQASKDARYEIVLEPKMAFGTGRHETTRTCLKLIDQRFRSGSRFLDLGCGSGILSVLAAKKGAKYIKAVDYDVIAVDNCRQNFALNEVDTPGEILFGSIEKCDGDRPYEFVCVNIIKRTILEMLPRLKDLTAVGGLLILSGLLLHDENEVSMRLDSLGLGRFTTNLDNDWLTFVVQRE